MKVIVFEPFMKEKLTKAILFLKKFLRFLFNKEIANIIHKRGLNGLRYK